MTRATVLSSGGAPARRGGAGGSPPGPGRAGRGRRPRRSRRGRGPAGRSRGVTSILGPMDARRGTRRRTRGRGERGEHAGRARGGCASVEAAVRRRTREQVAAQGAGVARRRAGASLARRIASTTRLTLLVPAAVERGLAGLGPAGDGVHREPVVADLGQQRRAWRRGSPASRSPSTRGPAPGGASAGVMVAPSVLPDETKRFRFIRRSASRASFPLPPHFFPVRPGDPSRRRSDAIAAAGQGAGSPRTRSTPGPAREHVVPDPPHVVSSADDATPRRCAATKRGSPGAT